MKDTFNSRDDVLIVLKNVNKSFGSTKALDQMDLMVFPGEIIGLVGSNGAGKSTLMKVLTGTYAVDSGELTVQKQNIDWKSYDVNSAKAIGIACAYQELSLCTNLKVYENFLLGNMANFSNNSIRVRKEGKKFAKRILDEVFPGHGISVNAYISHLSLGQKQMVEICKASVSGNLKVLILDEPTAFLPRERIEQLHQYLTQRSNEGIAIVYISHKLDEIQAICDQVVVMRNGKSCCNSDIAEISKEKMIHLMGGDAAREYKNISKTASTEKLLDIQNFNTKTVKNITMTIHRGEIIGISGLDGGGQSELLQALFTYGNKGYFGKSNIRFAYLSGDRAKEGLFPGWNIADNIVISDLSKVRQGGFLSKKKLYDVADFWYRKFNIKASGVDEEIATLSGGNAQKTLIARGLATDADIILLNDPTCGVDIGTKQEIYHFMQEQKQQGKTLILFSTEDIEMHQCDRVYIMHEGTIVEELNGEAITEKNIVSRSFAWKDSFDLEQQTKTDKKRGRKTLYLERASAIWHSRALVPILVFLVIFSVNAFLRPVIASYNGIKMLYLSTMPWVMAALGQMFVGVGGGMDMGNGMAVGLLNVTVAMIMVQNPLLGMLLCLLIIPLYGLMGVFIYKTRIPAVVVTLGMSFIWEGLALIISPKPGGGCPAWLKSIYNIKTPLIPSPIVFAVIAFLIAYWILNVSRYGVVMKATGNNPIVAQRAGWSIAKTTFFTYCVAGFFVMLSGLSLTAMAGSGDYSGASTFPMISLAIFILGGCEFSGAISSPMGVVAASFAMASVSSLLTFIKLDSNFQTMVTGLILVFAMAVKRIINRNKETEI